MTETSELTRSEKAVAVAKDVLTSLDLGHVRYRTGGYFREKDIMPEAGECLGSLADRPDDLSNHVEKVAQSCTVCLLGGCILSKAKLYDAMPSCVLKYGPRGIIDALKDVFSKKTITLMECTFETSTRPPTTDHIVTDTEEFFQTVTDTEEFFFERRRAAAAGDGEHPADRVRLVMENVIANNGEYRP